MLAEIDKAEEEQINKQTNEKVYLKHMHHSVIVISQNMPIKFISRIYDIN